MSFKTSPAKLVEGLDKVLPLIWLWITGYGGYETKVIFAYSSGRS